MGFVLLVLALLWLIIWPIVMYYAFKQNSESHAHIPYLIEANNNTFTITPMMTRHGVRLSMNANGTKFILDDRSTEQLIRNLRRTQLTVNSMQEVQELER